MAEVLSVTLPELADITTLKLFLHDAIGSPLNIGGDALTVVSDSGGLFHATLDENRTGLGTLHAIVGEVDDAPANVVWDGWLAPGTTLIVEDFPQASSADVKDAVVEALTEDLYPELASPPPATTTILDRIRWMFMWHRNKALQTATVRQLFADDQTTVVSEEQVGDDGTTFTAEEAA